MKILLPWTLVPPDGTWRTPYWVRTNIQKEVIAAVDPQDEELTEFEYSIVANINGVEVWEVSCGPNGCYDTAEEAMKEADHDLLARGYQFLKGKLEPFT